MYLLSNKSTKKDVIMKLTIYLGKSVLKYEAFEKLVFDPELSEHLFDEFYALLLMINQTLPNREERINIINTTECLFVLPNNTIIFDYKQ